jgi:hypothetical protein
MQIIENWADVVGTVVELRADDGVEGFTVVDLEVQGVTPVEGWPNLFEDAAGQRLLVSFPNELVEERAVAPGAVIRCRIRRGGTAAYVHPEHVQISTGDDIGL